MLDDIDHAAPKCRLQQVGVRQQQRARSHSLRGGCDIVLGIFVLRHDTIIAPARGRGGHQVWAQPIFVL
ncbi:hypothetical protein I553_8640 [Mycobacterium xenopi 4042]|uniref:Uncharacterized protein n=1 Tax=Mycobacterium xenopi 4042 TaxID=1299334 RepID=X8CJN7_MYCXE|nr:hypothetical protein I553_8640 [Mycobacterium xenopi 4042]